MNHVRFFQTTYRRRSDNSAKAARVDRGDGHCLRLGGHRDWSDPGRTPRGRPGRRAIRRARAGSALSFVCRNRQPGRTGSGEHRHAAGINRDR